MGTPDDMTLYAVHWMCILCAQACTEAFPHTHQMGLSHPGFPLCVLQGWVHIHATPPNLMCPYCAHLPASEQMPMRMLWHSSVASTPVSYASSYSWKALSTSPCLAHTISKQPYVVAVGTRFPAAFISSNTCSDVCNLDCCHKSYSSLHAVITTLLYANCMY